MSKTYRRDRQHACDDVLWLGGASSARPCACPHFCPRAKSDRSLRLFGLSVLGFERSRVCQIAMLRHWWRCLGAPCARIVGSMCYGGRSAAPVGCRSARAACSVPHAGSRLPLAARCACSVERCVGASILPVCSSLFYIVLPGTPSQHLFLHPFLPRAATPNVAFQTYPRDDHSTPKGLIDYLFPGRPPYLKWLQDFPNEMGPKHTTSPSKTPQELPEDPSLLGPVSC